MPFIPVNHVLQMTLNWTVAATEHPKNVLGLKGRTYGVVNQAGVDAIGDIVAAAFDSSGIEAYLSTQTRLNDVTVTDLTTSSGVQFTSHDLDEAGESNTDYLPTQSAGMIEWITGLRGASYRGRTFLPGFTENASDGRPIAGCITKIKAFGDDLISGLDAVDFDLVVISRFSGTQQVAGRHPGDVITVPKPRVGGGIATVITDCAAETVWKTQRRRSTPG